MNGFRSLQPLKPLFHTGVRLLDPVARLLSPDDDYCDLEPLRLVFPVHPKDCRWLPAAVAHARRNVLHPIKEVVFLGEPTAELEDLARQCDARLFPEDNAIEGKSAHFRKELLARGFDRWNWIYQQLLKLSIDQWLPGESFLVIDADTLLLRPTAFKVGDRILQQFSHEKSYLYQRSYRHLTGDPDWFRFSLVTHFFFAERTHLTALRDRIETHTGQPWQQAIMELADAELWTEEEKALKFFNYFSEYETYGNFLRTRCDDIRTRYFFNRSADDFDERRETLAEYLHALPKIYRWASFHHYLYGSD